MRTRCIGPLSGTSNCLHADFETQHGQLGLEVVRVLRPSGRRRPAGKAVRRSPVPQALRRAPASLARSGSGAPCGPRLLLASQNIVELELALHRLVAGLARQRERCLGSATVRLRLGARRPVLEGQRGLVEIPDHAEGDADADHQAEDEAKQGAAVLREPSIHSHYMCSGAETPRMCRPLAMTRRTATASARRACFCAASSTSRRSALYQAWKSAASSRR